MAAESVLKAAVVSPAIGVLVIDDEPAFLDLLDAMLARAPGIDAVRKIARGRHAVAVARLFRPAVAVVDLNLHDIPGEALCRRLRALEQPPAIVMCTGENTEAAVWRSFRAGAAGFVAKPSSDLAGRLQQAVREVAHGGTYADPEWAHLHRSFLAGETPFGLSYREIEVARLVASGWSNDDIAAELSISRETVKSHVQSILRKLGITDRTGVAPRAITSGLIAPHELRRQDPLSRGMPGLVMSG